MMARDQENRIVYQWTDAWLLQAISLAGCRQPAELKDINAAGDAINHAIFTDEEIKGGLARLSRGGWIKGQGGRFATTRKFKVLEAKLSRVHLTAVEQIEKLLAVVSKGNKESSLAKGSTARYPGLSASAIQRATKAYQKEGWTIIRKLTGK